MHWSVKRTFNLFIEQYLDSEEKISVLEIGSANVNGGLRDQALPNMNWVGVDLEFGPGVDYIVKVGQSLPFPNDSFDLVVASSVFEHDIQFWNTYLEMARVLKHDGFLLLIAPSQGNFHRYPLDAFRFYPDSGIALEKWGQFSSFPIHLVESFTTLPQNDIWADFVAIYSYNKVVSKDSLIGGMLEGENWVVGSELVASTYQEVPYEVRRIFELESANQELLISIKRISEEIRAIKSSWAWRASMLWRERLNRLRRKDFSQNQQPE
jgi:SAM-dependent methyltransferase